MSVRELFGGALQIDIPERFVDVSTIREIPDNQEVFTDVHTDQSFIIELLTMAEEQNVGALKYHFEQLATDNESNQNHIHSLQTLTTADMPHFGDDFYKGQLVGSQQISKYHEQSSNLVNVYLALVRLPAYSTDILISLNDPVVISPQSSSYQASATLNPASNLEFFKQILKTFQLKDPSIFG